MKIRGRCMIKREVLMGIFRDLGEEEGLKDRRSIRGFLICLNIILGGLPEIKILIWETFSPLKIYSMNRVQVVEETM
jgi:hypothetical protein